MKNPLETILAYHQRTKHHFQRYATGPDGLDWASQPNPFRTFEGCKQLELPLLIEQPHPLYTDLYEPKAISAQPLTLKNIAELLELSFSISAWKQYENTRWALRCNPSSGNLHPTEAYVISEGCEGIADGVHHYVSRDHILEQRCQFDSKKHLLPAESFLIGLSSIHWREAWKYGERAFRYCQHDVGHGIAAVRYAAALLGWQAQVLSSSSDEEISAILGIDREADFGPAEREHADVMLLITARNSVTANDTPDLEQIVHIAKSGQWFGKANVLSVLHANDWPVIEEAAVACTKPETETQPWFAPSLPTPVSSSCEKSAIAIIKQRRSAQSFDGKTGMAANVFYRMLDLTLPRQNTVPWDTIDWAPRIHLVLFVHRVEGLAPGLYLFLRNDSIEAFLRSHLSSEFEWVKPEGCPEHLVLFRLVAADAQNAAQALSCRQDIASDGAFSLGMLAEYEASLAHGSWIYRQLFWEAGILGQVLYLESEAAGLRGTGIGCYFDDGVHDVLGIKGHAIQSMYHFTVGTALADERLQTLPAYDHIKRN
ncbi:SagB/ThcOx family dehydrogenase [Sulfurirhabdus autotrophica]|uniref:SagB-type dehydrogenase family enzyme n=1 Tax=Sulfurirhabdus autotrophica TaxID=1706046 RepID=A0A4R3YAE7_9PROT|nr:SagB/ThcOx family dehydrogenase [Sulfurirhabdus autotrophica]TCV87343.1 SagB-type dehydrogenase family enzyme [Sulfurirhabdus autotrophica]